MDPNNALCNQISASGACDFQRMYNFSNYPTAGNGYYTGANTGGSVFTGGGLPYNTDITYNNGNYTYSNKPDKWMVGLGVIGAIGTVFGAYAQGKAAEEQQKQIQEQQRLQYIAYQEQSDRMWSMQERQMQKQNGSDAMSSMLQMMMMMKMMEKMDF